MAIRDNADVELKYEWPFMVAALNRRAQRRRLRPGELSEAVGIDGRFTGALKKFAGMKHLRTLSGIADGVINFWRVSIQKGTTAFLLQGFLVLYDDGGTNKLKFFYYDEDPARLVWEVYAVVGFDPIADGTQINVAGPAKFLYVAIDGQAPRVLYNTAAAAGVASASFVHGAMGPGAAYDSVGDVGLLVPVCDDVEHAAGHLSDGVYSVAYRFYNSARGVYSAISAILSQTIAGDDKYVEITNPYAADLDGAWDAGYDKLQVFRSMTAEVAGSTFAAGLLYFEKEFDLDIGADCWPATVTAGTEMDEALLFSPVYDPLRDVCGSPPHGGTIAYMERVNFMGSGTAGGSVVAQLQWSHIHRENVEVFPTAGHSHVWGAEDGQVQQFIRAGDMLYVFADNAAYRLAKNGAQLAIGRMHSGRSLVAPGAAHEMGRDILAVTNLGVTIYDGTTGALQTLGALDRVIFKDWAASLDDVLVVGDARMGVSFILNTTEKEAMLVWHVTGAVSKLEDCNFVDATGGTHPEDRGRSRAWFITCGGRIVYADEDSTGTGTLLGIDSTVTMNGAATGGSATTLVMATALNWTDANLVGATVHVWSGASTTERPQSAEITSVTAGGTTLNFGALGTAVASGDRFTISPVVFRVRGWPLPNPTGPENFGRRRCRSMAVHCTDLSGAAGNPNAVFHAGVCRDLEDEPGQELAQIAMDENPSNCFASVTRDGHVLEPWVEHISAGTSFELLSLAVDAIITVSREAAD